MTHPPTPPAQSSKKRRTHPPHLRSPFARSPFATADRLWFQRVNLDRLATRARHQHDKVVVDDLVLGSCIFELGRQRNPSGVVVAFLEQRVNLLIKTMGTREGDGTEDAANKKNACSHVGHAIYYSRFGVGGCKPASARVAHRRTTTESRLGVSVLAKDGTRLRMGHLVGRILVGGWADAPHLGPLRTRRRDAAVAKHGLDEWVLRHAAERGVGSDKGGRLRLKHKYLAQGAQRTPTDTHSLTHSLTVRRHSRNLTD